MGKNGYVTTWKPLYKRGGSMKRGTIALIFVLVGIFLLLNANNVISGADESTVRLRIPNLPSGGWCDPQDRIRSILAGIDGLVKYSLNPLSFSVEVSFDAKKASVEEIVKKLAEGGYPISGEPQILEWCCSASGKKHSHVLQGDRLQDHPNALSFDRTEISRE
jgi:hypothetical protein